MVRCATFAGSGGMRMKPGEDIQCMIEVKVTMSDKRKAWWEVMFLG
jgi:hypothetical protein